MAQQLLMFADEGLRLFYIMQWSKGMKIDIKYT